MANALDWLSNNDVDLNSVIADDLLSIDSFRIIGGGIAAGGASKDDMDAARNWTRKNDARSLKGLDDPSSVGCNSRPRELTNEQKRVQEMAGALEWFIGSHKVNDDTVKAQVWQLLWM